jgi:hypothetical protein
MKHRSLRIKRHSIAPVKRRAIPSRNLSMTIYAHTLDRISSVYDQTSEQTGGHPLDPIQHAELLGVVTWFSCTQIA